MGRTMSTDVTGLAAVRLLAGGAVIFSAAELARGIGTPALPALGTLTLVTNGALALAAVALLVRPRVTWPAIALAATCGVAALLGTAAALPAGAEPTSWVPVAQMLALSAAGLLHLSRVAQATIERSIGIAALVLAAMCALFGVIHLLNVGTIDGMIPRWFPFRDVLPLVTGSILIAAAPGMIARRSRAIAAIVVSAMFASWIVFLHIPRLTAQTDDPAEWSFAAMALALTGALLVLASADFAARESSSGLARRSKPPRSGGGSRELV